jgi:hypothetical protein
MRPIGSRSSLYTAAGRGTVTSWEGSGQEAAFTFLDDGQYGEHSTLLNRHGSVLWQSLCCCGFDGAGTRRQAHAGTVCEAIPEWPTRRNLYH